MIAAPNSVATVIDKENMLAVLDGFWKQCDEASQLGLNIRVTGQIDAIIVAGMGGSGMPGEILRSDLSTKVHIHSCRDYLLPGWAGKNTLVFCISYSGNTEETLSAYKDARKKGCRIVCIAAGGKLLDYAQRDKVPFVRVPSGIQPRDAVGYQTIPVLNILMQSGVISKTADIQKMIPILQMTDRQKARDIARNLLNKIPVIYASSRMIGLAKIWKAKINENAKCQAFYNEFSEVNHNEMVGFTNLKADYYIIMIEDEEDHERIRKRMEITKQLLQQQGCPVLLMKLTGKNRLARIFSTILLGSYIGYYLALEYKVDPSPIAMVDELKRMLSK